jgi:putative N6-adenine-specific DNA methylase
MKYIAKTLYGLENILAGELETLGASDIFVLNRAVAFSGDMKLLYKTNYCLRTALSVLMTIAEFRIRSGNDLYKSSLKVEWDNFLDPDKTFSIVPVINSPLFRHTGYAGLVLKDSIADWFREKAGIRPSVNTENPGIVFNLHISNDLATISMDSTVVPLYKRGYRKEQGSAPMNEVLAAGIVLLSGWNKDSTLVDPMCGSGTIPIEAAMIGSGIPPGRFRQFYGFRRWKDYDEDLFDQVKNESESKTVVSGIRIFGSDISENSVSQAKINIESAGLSEIVSIRQADFRDIKATDNDGVIIMNPPYGQRMKISETDNLYSMIGSTLKHNFPGYKAFLITSDKESLKQVGLKPALKTTLYNGSLECILVKYELYHGSKKAKVDNTSNQQPAI